MTTGGAIFLVCSLLFVWSLAGYCYYRVLTEPRRGDSDTGPNR